MRASIGSHIRRIVGAAREQHRDATIRLQRVACVCHEVHDRLIALRRNHQQRRDRLQPDRRMKPCGLRGALVPSFTHMLNPQAIGQPLYLKDDRNDSGEMTKPAPLVPTDWTAFLNHQFVPTFPLLSTLR